MCSEATGSVVLRRRRQVTHCSRERRVHFWGSPGGICVQMDSPVKDSSVLLCDYHSTIAPVCSSVTAEKAMAYQRPQLSEMF